MNNKWVLVGKVLVDSGQLMIVDPCYMNYKDIQEIDGEIERRINTDEKYGQVRNDSAFAFESGLGDGSYRVYAKFKVFKDWGKRITEVKIKLI